MHLDRHIIQTASLTCTVVFQSLHDLRRLRVFVLDQMLVVSIAVFLLDSMCVCRRQVVRCLQSVEGSVGSPTVPFLHGLNTLQRFHETHWPVQSSLLFENSDRCGAASSSSFSSSSGTSSSSFRSKYSRWSPPKAELLPTTSAAAASSDEASLQLSAATFSVRAANQSAARICASV